MLRKRSDRDQFWSSVWRLARLFALGMLPVLDLPSRYRIRRLAVKLVRCDPWPGMAATGEDAAQLAILRLRWLQGATRRAVRSRQAEAATMLARASIETLITGLYCLYEQDAVAKLQAQNVRNLPLLMKFMIDMSMIPESVLAECITRLDSGAPGKGPTVEAMALAVDNSLGVRAAIDIYDRFYRPASTLSAHGGGASLLRHVNTDDHLTRRPGLAWARRSPARIADACLGALTANMARRAGEPSRVADKYTDRHFSRALTPMVTMSRSVLVALVAPRQIMTTVTSMRRIDNYIKAGQSVEDPATRVELIRAEIAGLLFAGVPNTPAEAFDPYLDYISEMLAAQVTPSSGEAPASAVTAPAS